MEEAGRWGGELIDRLNVLAGWPGRAMVIPAGKHTRTCGALPWPRPGTPVFPATRGKVGGGKGTSVAIDGRQGNNLKKWGVQNLDRCYFIEIQYVIRINWSISVHSKTV